MTHRRCSASAFAALICLGCSSSDDGRAPSPADAGSGGSAVLNGSGGSTPAAGGASGGVSQSSGGSAGAPSAGAAGTGGANDGGAGGATGNGGTMSGGSGGTGGSTTGTLAVRVLDFLGSIGACTHIGQGVDAAQQSATALWYAGIRNIRDDGSPGHVQDWITVHQQSGARLSLLTNKSVPSTIDMAKQLHAAGALLAVEGPNEPNNFQVTYENQTATFDTTFLPVAHFQRDLYQAVKAEPALAGIPVFHSSEAGGAEPDNVGLQFLTIPNGAGTDMPDGTVYADFANTHNYVCGHQNRLVDNTSWNAVDPTLNDDWDGLYVEYGHTWHGGFQGYSNDELQSLPRVSTETGWLTQGNGAITEAQQGKVFLNLYLSGYKRGWAYTFVYMLRDDPGQGYWGLFDTNYNPKQSGLYLHNLTTILADSGTGPPGRLDYSIPNEPATVHDFLMQKSSGTFELAVWNDQPGGGSDDVTVDLASRATVKVYDPTTGTSAIQTLSDVSSVSLTLTDHPVILEL